MSGIAGWLQVLLALVSIALLLNNAQKFQAVTPGEPIATVQKPDGPLDKIGGAINGAIDWLQDSMPIGSYQVPNWLVLLGGAIFLFALFRR